MKSEETDDHKCNIHNTSVSCTNRYEQNQLPLPHQIPRKHQLHQPPPVSRQSNMPQLPQLTRIPQNHEYSPHLNIQQQGSKDKECELLSHTRDLTKHSQTVNEGQQDNKCESCGKSFSRLQNLEKHLHTIHDG